MPRQCFKLDSVFPHDGVGQRQVVGHSAWVIPSERDPRSEAERVGSQVIQGALLARSPSRPPQGSLKGYQS